MLSTFCWQIGPICQILPWAQIAVKTRFAAFGIFCCIFSTCNPKQRVCAWIFQLSIISQSQVTCEPLTTVWLGPLPTVIINCPALARYQHIRHCLGGCVSIYATRQRINVNHFSLLNLCRQLFEKEEFSGRRVDMIFLMFLHFFAPYF